LLLAISAFSLSLLGTFLVRSGVLISVHSFAADPERGVFILMFLLLTIGGALTLYAWRAPRLASTAGFELWSRESFLLFNNILLVAAAVLILGGTLFPLIMDALGQKQVSVGPPYFDRTFLMFALPLLALLGLGMHASWKRARLQNVQRPLLVAFVVALAAAIFLAAFVFGAFKVLAVIGFTLALWLMYSAVREPIARLRAGHTLPAAILGMSIAHFGVGVFTLGVTGVEAFKITEDLVMKAGDRVAVGDYRFAFIGTRPVQGPNYDAVEGEVVIERDGRTIATLHPQRRTYRVQQSPMTEAGIHVGWTRDLFVAMGEPRGTGFWSMRIQYKPLVRYIWIGALIMALGGLVACTDRRYRTVRAGEHARGPAGAVAGEVG
jgi:cytochrome c-type biogenesis protein CcmF